MRGTMLYAPDDIRLEEGAKPTIQAPGDAIVRISAACVCGSDLWPYRGIVPIAGPVPMGPEYAGVVEEAGSDVRTIKQQTHGHGPAVRASRQRPSDGS